MITYNFILDFKETIEDLIEKHFDELADGTTIRGGYELVDAVVDAAIQAAAQYLKERKI